jgi:hypothetical protein
MISTRHTQISLLLLLMLYPLGHNFAQGYEPLQNVTISVPTGTVVNNVDHELCLHAGWYQFGTFYLGNYFIHAGTVRRPPGTCLAHYSLAVIAALLIPGSGLMLGFLTCSRGLTQIPYNKFRFWHLSYWTEYTSKQKLQTAQRVGALCMVVRKLDWKCLDPTSLLSMEGVYTARPNTAQKEGKARDLKS